MKSLKKGILALVIACAAMAAVPAAAKPVEAAVTVYQSHPISSLTAKQKNIAAAIMKKVKNTSKAKATVTYSCTVNDFVKAWQAIDDSYFRYYSVIHLNAWKLTRNGKTVGVKVELYPKDSLKRYKRHLANKAKLKSIAKKITRGKKTQRAKVLAINNYVCKKLTWRDNSGTLDVALRTSYAKCTGYATLFMALCEQCGIKCCQVAGYAGGGHDWNQVRVNGTWYYIDPTWNDGTGNKYTLSKTLWSDHTIWAKMYVINFRSCGYTFDL